MTREINPENPPAMTILIADGVTRAWDRPTLLSMERESVVWGMRNHLQCPSEIMRPMCIVRLKAWK